MSFYKRYFTISIIIFFIEIIISKYATGLIRHTFGDYLVVILLYCFIKSFINITVEKAVIITLIISFIIEFLQLSDLQNIYPEKYAKVFKIILGTSFSIGDLVAYTLGVITIYWVEKLMRKINTAS